MNPDFGPYQIVNKIGVGGMATVYTAVQKSLGRTVVLKTMHEHLREDPTFVARFEREAKAAAAMSHDNIVQIIDYGLVDETWYIAMEYVSGPDLKKWLERNDPLPVEIGTLLLYDVCAGLAHAHAHHVIHRDIKPANIMLAPTGVPKLADFGLAKQTQESTVLTVHDTMIGTVPYMSPEHATGQHVDERSDIFSLGVVAYEIFGGRRPFPGGSSASVINAIITLEPLPLANLNPLVTDDLHRVVSKMLEKDPAKRYPTADAVRRDLEVVIDEWGVTRGRDLLAEYLANPGAVRASLTGRRFREHLNRARQFRGMGLGKIDDAIREFERAHYLAPDDEEVGRELDKLRAERPEHGSSGTEDRGAEHGPGFRFPKGRSRIAVGAAAAALVFAGALLALGGGKEESAPIATGPVAPERSEARVASASEPAPTPVSSPASPPHSSPAPAPDPSPAPARSKSVAPGAEAPKSAPAPAPAPASGSLEITARPSATFLVNGRVFAEDVSAVSLLFAPGVYDVRLDNPYYGSKSWSGVEVVSNEAKALSHDFTKEAKGSFLTITTNRIPAMIWIDGAPTDKWTPQREFPVAPGLHRVTVKKDGFRTEEGIVEAGVRDGATVELSFTLKETDES
jgi:tRNA A-37 threonylcarbamoyl transferase component Bud32